MSTDDKEKKVEDLVKKALREALEKRRKVTEDEYILTIDEPIESPETTMSTKAKDPVVVPSGKALASVVIRNKKLLDYAVADLVVSVFEESSWDPRISGFIPKVDPDYIFDPKLALDVLRAWELDEKVLCYGPTGAGKSSMIEQLCAVTGRPFIRINCTGDMDSSMIFGQLTAKDGSTHWVDGAVTEAVRYGAVFAWDEWDVTPPEISMGLQWLLEDNGKLFLKEMPGTTKEKQIIPHKDFKLVAIGNTQGQGDDTGSHAGTNVQNSATLDRFGTAVFVNYLAPEIEEQMLLKKWKSAINAKMAKELIKLANLIRQGYKANQLNLTISPRTLFSICKKLSFGSSLHDAFKVVYLNKLNPTQYKVADELFTKIFGRNVT